MSDGLRWGKVLLRWLVTPFAVSVVGCASTPIYIPEPIPAFMREGSGIAVAPPETPQYQSGVQSVKDAEKSKDYNPKAENRPSVISLPQAIEESIAYNLRLRVGMEKVQAARADLTNSSIIPNPTLTADTQFQPLPGAHPYQQNNGAGPLQYDGLVSFPIDWFIFGKRKAAMEASRLGVDVAAADFADLVRKQVASTLDAFYDILEAKAQIKLTQVDLEDLKRIEKIKTDQIKLGGAGLIELDRIKLAVVDAQRELRRRELTLFATRSKIRPMLGRLQVDAQFDITGELGVTGTVPAPSYDEVILLAEQSRPDILSDMRDIQRAQAAVRLEERKAYPIVNFQPGLSYQQTKFITGLPSQRFLDFYLSSTLPTTDRNQGGIAKAQSDLRNRFMTLQADLTDLRAEVEQAVETYRVALATITADDPATLKAAKDVRDKTEEAWKAGGLKLLDLLDAQRAYRDRVRASISSQADYWRALNRLNAAIGIRAVGEELPPKDKEPAQPPKK